MDDWTVAETWDVLFLGGVRIPGIARVEVHAPTGIDVQKARGKKKARVVDRGNEPAELSIEIEIDPSEMDALFTVMNLLRPRGGSAAQKELLIGHPAAEFWGINMVKIGDMGSPHPGAGDSFFLNFTAIEHTPEPKKVKKPKPAVSSEDDNAAWNANALAAANLAETQDPAKTGAAEKNFSAIEDVVNYSSVDGSTAYVPMN